MDKRALSACRLSDRGPKRDCVVALGASINANDDSLEHCSSLKTQWLIHNAT